MPDVQTLVQDCLRNLKRSAGATPPAEPYGLWLPSCLYGNGEIIFTGMPPVSETNPRLNPHLLKEEQLRAPRIALRDWSINFPTYDPRSRERMANLAHLVSQAHMESSDGWFREHPIEVIYARTREAAERKLFMVKISPDELTLFYVHRHAGVLGIMTIPATPKGPKTGLDLIRPFVLNFSMCYDDQSLHQLFFVFRPWTPCGRVLAFTEWRRNDPVATHHLYPDSDDPEIKRCELQSREILAATELWTQRLPKTADGAIIEAQ